MNTILCAEMFEGDRKQTLAVVQQVRTCDAGVELPFMVVRSDKDLMPAAPPPAGRRDFDLIRI